MEMGQIIAAQAQGQFCCDCGTPISLYSRGRCPPCGYVGRKRNAPEGFLEVLSKLGSLDCARHYRASASTVTRWRREASVPLHSKAKHPLRVVRGAQGFRERPLIVTREWSVPGQAADFLRHVGAVYRCTMDGKPLGKKAKCANTGYWNRNGFVLTDEELISRAVRLGWVRPEF